MTKYNINWFIYKAKLVHGDKYDYSKVIYKNERTKIPIICYIHGEFNKKPMDFLRGFGCPKCNKNNKLTTIEFIEKAKLIHNNFYDYSKVTYINSYTKITIICPEHGEFEQVPNSHLKKKGCPVCSSSYGEKIIKNFLNNNKINFIKQAKFSQCRYKLALPFDFYLPEYNLIIEFDGKQHREPIGFGGDPIKNFKYVQMTDAIKNKYCMDHGIKLIRISNINQITNILNKELNYKKIINV